MSKAIKLTQEKDFLLPPMLIGRIDVSRLLREIEKVDNELETQAIQNPQKPPVIPSMSRMLSDTVQMNQIDLTNLDGRKDLLKGLRAVKEHAPLVHIVFAIDAEPEITSQLVAWIRQNLHPHGLVSVGLQPSIVGGCVIRTPDHIYDFSLRQRFKQQQPALVEQLNAVAAGA